MQLHLVSKTFFCRNINLPQLYGQGVSIDPLPTWTAFGELTFLDQALKEFELGLDSILMDPFEITEMDASFD